MVDRVRPSGGEEGEREREQWSKWGEGERTERRGGLLTTREQVGGGMARGGMAPAPLVATVKGERERELPGGSQMQVFKPFSLFFSQILKQQVQLFKRAI